MSVEIVVETEVVVQAEADVVVGDAAVAMDVIVQVRAGEWEVQVSAKFGIVVGVEVVGVEVVCVETEGVEMVEDVLN